MPNGCKQWLQSSWQDNFLLFDVHNTIYAWFNFFLFSSITDRQQQKSALDFIWTVLINTLALINVFIYQSICVSLLHPLLISWEKQWTDWMCLCNDVFCHYQFVLCIARLILGKMTNWKKLKDFHLNNILSSTWSNLPPLSVIKNQIWTFSDSKSHPFTV